MNNPSNPSAKPASQMKTRRLILASLIFGLMAVPFSSFGQSLVSLSPSSAQANGPGFNLQVTGVGFTATTKVYWDTTLLPGLWDGLSNITVVVSSSMLITTADITTVPITVKVGSVTSHPLAFLIYSPVVGLSQSGAVPSGGGSIQVQSVYSYTGSGVLASFYHLGSGDATVTVANYNSQPPLTGPIFDAGGGFYDLQITGASSSDSATAVFYYPKNAATDANEVNPSFVLQYWAGATLGWQTVKDAGGNPATKEITDNLDGYLSGGRFTFTFTDTTTPSILALSGTIFTMAPAVAAPPTPLTPQVATGMLVTTVNQLAALGTINAGNATALTSVLNNAIASMNAGNITAARNQLQAFINSVNALVRSRRLSAATGAGLIDAARQIISTLQP